MKIRLEVDGKVFEYERRPMKAERFRALCKLAAAGIYAGMVAAVASICGFPGLAVVAVATLLCGAGYLMEI